MAAGGVTWCPIPRLIPRAVGQSQKWGAGGSGLRAPVGRQWTALSVVVSLSKMTCGLGEAIQAGLDVGPSPSSPALAASQQVGVGSPQAARRWSMPSWATRAPRTLGNPESAPCLWVLPRPSAFLSGALCGWVLGRLRGEWGGLVNGPPGRQQHLEHVGPFVNAPCVLRAALAGGCGWGLPHCAPEPRFSWQ